MSSIAESRREGGNAKNRNHVEERAFDLSPDRFVGTRRAFDH
jgi:hypothetical protein